MSVLKSRKTIIGLILITLFFFMFWSRFELNLKYFYYPERDRHSDFGGGIEEQAAKQIILCDHKEYSNVTNNSSLNTMMISTKVEAYNLIDLALQWNCHEVFEQMLKQGARVDDANIQAVIFTKDNFYFDKLIEYGVDIIGLGSVKYSLLNSAMISSDFYKFNRLIELGANVNQVECGTKECLSVLDLSVRKNKKNFENNLKSKGAKTYEELKAEGKIK